MKRIVSMAMSLLLAASVNLPAFAEPVLASRITQPAKNGAAKDVSADKDASAAVRVLSTPKEPDGSDWPDPLTPEYTQAVKDFSARTTARLLGETTENAMYSPASLYMALSLAAQGARGDTQKELLEALGIEADALAAQSRRLYEQLYAADERGIQKMANSLWIGQGQAPVRQYLDTAGDDFYASVFQTDFAAPEAGEAMSKWVAENTGGVLAPKLETNEGWRLAILNTLYLKAAWQHPFPEEETRDEPFYLADGTPVTLPFMHNELDYHAFWKGPGYQASELPARLGRMVVVLPDEGVSPASLLADPEKLSAILAPKTGDTAYSKVIFSVPKFAFGNTFKLDETLQGVGVEKAFTGGADFSGMLAGSTYLSDIQQGTHIAVDEEGMEAAAYTIMPANTGGGPPESIGVEYMKLDRPFFFAILGCYEGIPLFIGTVTDPSITN